MVVRGDVEFDQLLETALQQQVGRLISSKINRPAYRAHLSPGLTRPLFANLRPSRAALVLAAGVLAGGGAAGAFSGAPVGSWGRTVTTAVQTCTGSLAAGQNGIGPCVSSVARLHGAVVSASHAHVTPSPKADPGQGHGQGNGQNNGQDNSGKGESGAHPTPDAQASDHQDGSGNADHSQSHGSGHGKH